MTAEQARPLTILVVEDQDDAAHSTVELLTLYGHQARVATSGPDALAALAHEVPDVVLLDIGLPRMNGWEVAERLRAQIHGKQPFVVAVTGYGDEDDRWRSAASGIDMHLIKPVDPRALIDLLARISESLFTQRPPESPTGRS